MNANDPLRSSLAPLIHGGSTERVRRRVEEILPPDVFARPAGLTDAERFALTYERLRHVNARIEGDAPLLRRRELLFALFERVAVADPSLFYAFFLHHCTVIGALLEFGEGRDDLGDLLDDLTSSRTLGALLMTELGHGNSNAAVMTEAVYDPRTREFVLDTPDPRAVKFPPSAAFPGVARIGVVTARLKAGGRDHGAFCFLVPLRDADGPRPGVRIAPMTPAPMIPLDWSAIAFDKVRVPFRNWLRDTATLDDDGVLNDPLGDPQVRSLQVTRVIRHVWEGATVGLASVTRAAAAVAVRHAHKRRTTGTFAPDLPVIRYRNQQLTLFGALSSAFVASMAARAVAVSGPSPLTVPNARGSFLVKAVVDEIAERVTAACRTASGALGFLPENRFLDYQGLAHSFNAAAVSNEMLFLTAAATLATGQEYEPPNEEPPAAADRDLTHPAVWTALLAARERRQHRELTEGLRAAAEKGRDRFDAWNDHIHLAEQLARTHAAGLVARTVRDGLETLSDPWARGIAQRLCALHFLDDLAAHDGWYLTEGLLSAEEVRNIPALRDGICQQLAPHALDLAEALDVPYDLVGAPIAGDDYVADLAGAVIGDAAGEVASAVTDRDAQGRPAGH